MSFMDKAKDALTQAKGKAADLAEQHGDKIDQGINKAGTFVDKKTGGKYADKIDQAQSKARAGADKLAERTGPNAHLAGQPTTGTPTTGTPTTVTPKSVDSTADPHVVPPFTPTADPVAVDHVDSDPVDDPVAKSDPGGDIADDRTGGSTPAV